MVHRILRETENSNPEIQKINQQVNQSSTQQIMNPANTPIDIEINTEEASDPKLTWSGKSPHPKINTRVGIPSHPTPLKGIVNAFFKTETRDASYLGIIACLEEIPSDPAHRWNSNLIESIHDQGLDGLIALIDCGCLCKLYGAEIQEPPEETHWYKTHKLTCQDELAAIAPAIFGGKQWREDLAHAWNYGHWNKTPYNKLSDRLQRIRNTAHMEYIKWAVEKNHKLIRLCRPITIY